MKKGFTLIELLLAVLLLGVMSVVSIVTSRSAMETSASVSSFTDVGRRSSS